jgi:cell division protein FtsA
MTKKLLRPKGSIIAAIDIGSAKTACLIAHVVDNQGTSEVIGIGHVASQGVKAGVIVDLKQTQNSVKKAIHAAEVMAAKIMKGYPLRDVVMNVPSVYTQSKRSTVSIRINGDTITDKDIRSALIQVEEDECEDAMEFIHCIPTAFSADNHQGVENPIGLHADTLKVDMHCVKAERAALQNVLTCGEDSHLDVDCLCVAPYAAGLASLVPDEINMGCLCIDIGAGVTSYAVFCKGAMIHTGAIPVGGWHVTNDLATGLNTSFNDAERLKTLYGSCATNVSDDNEMINVPLLGEDQSVEDRNVPRTTLTNIIRPRVEEIFELIRGDIDVNGMDGYSGGRVVLTGGGSQLSGIRDLASLMLNKQVRVGRPAHLAGLAEMTSGPDFAATAGLIHYACERLGEQPKLDEENASDQAFLPRIKAWIKENW